MQLHLLFRINVSFYQNICSDLFIICMPDWMPDVHLVLDVLIIRCVYWKTMFQELYNVFRLTNSRTKDGNSWYTAKWVVSTSRFFITLHVNKLNKNVKMLFWCSMLIISGLRNIRIFSDLNFYIILLDFNTWFTL